MVHDSALVVRRPGECTFFTPGCEVGVDKVEFTPEMIRVRVFVFVPDNMSARAISVRVTSPCKFVLDRHVLA